MCDEVDGVGGLDVLGQQQYPHVGKELLDRACGASAFVGVGGRHADVHDDKVGSISFDGGEQLIGVAEGGDDMMGAVSEEAGETFA